MTDIMIDIETLGTGTNAVVLSIGAVKFDIEKGKIGSTFHMALDIQEQMNAGRVVDAQTLAWWMKQPQEVLTPLFEKAKPVKEVLELFTRWAGKNLYVHGNGAGFDITIMESLYSSMGKKHFWKYNKIMDLRTFKRFSNPNNYTIDNKGDKHNALDDAMAQAKFVIKCLKEEDHDIEN